MYPFTVRIFINEWIIQAIGIPVNPVSTSLLQLFNDQELAYIQRTYI